MKIRKYSFNIYTLLLISIFFDAYVLFYIQTFPVTIFTIVSILFVIQCVVGSKLKKFKLTNQNILLLLLIVCLIVNYVMFSFHNTTSFLQSIYFIALSLLAYRNESNAIFENYCSLLQKSMTYMSIYGIYQFIGRILELPFTDLVIKNHMVTGYNWTNTTYVLGQIVYRTNVIFREPSHFAQMLSISLLLFVPKFFQKGKKEKKVILSAALQVIAMFTTFSGTGIVMVATGFVIFVCMMIKKKSFLMKIVPVVILSLCFAIYVLLFTSIGNYYLNRANELFVYNRDASSGFIRFRTWIMVVEEAWNSNVLFGSGIGTGTDYVSKYAMQYYGMTLSGFAKVATELGLIGVILWSGFIISFLMKKQNIVISKEYLIIICSLIPLIFMQEAFSSNLFWMLIMLINCKLYCKNEGAN